MTEIPIGFATLKKRTSAIKWRKLWRELRPLAAILAVIVSALQWGAMSQQSSDARRSVTEAAREATKNDERQDALIALNTALADRAAKSADSGQSLATSNASQNQL